MMLRLLRGQGGEEKIKEDLVVDYQRRQTRSAGGYCWTGPDAGRLTMMDEELELPK